jgi:copper chaperone CopZ
MTCFACVHGVTGALSRVPGVTRVEVNLDTGRAIVHGGADPEALRARQRRARGNGRRDRRCC